MFKAYADPDSTEKKVEAKPSTNEIIWLENKSFDGDLPRKPKNVEKERKEEKQNPSSNVKQETKIFIEKKKTENSEVFYVDRQRDRANITVQYLSGVPRYGAKFCCQTALGDVSRKKIRKEKLKRYFHERFEQEKSSFDELVSVDSHLERLNVNVREQEHSFEAWKELIDYQRFLFKNLDEHFYRKQLSIAERALESNNNRLQYRLMKLNIRTASHLFDLETIEEEWTSLINDSFKSSDDRTVNETWTSYIDFLLNRVEIFSIEKIERTLTRFYSTYNYHIQTRSDKERRFITNHMIEIFHIWSRVLRDGGFLERSIALYQTMIELSLDSSGPKFNERLEKFGKFWDSPKIRFGENENISDPVEFLEKELKICSEEENHRLTTKFDSWIFIEKIREKFYQEKIVNFGFHVNSILLSKLDDSTQIDPELSTMTFDRSIRPFLFECSDQRSILQLILNFLDLINALPNFQIVEEIVHRWKINLHRKFYEQFVIEQEFCEISNLIEVQEKCRTEKIFSFEFISRIFEKLINVSTLKTVQIDIILLYLYYAAENVVELKEKNPTIYKIRWKNFQNLLKKFLSMDEYRSNLRIYSHYGRIESEIFSRQTESRRIFDLCFKTIESNWKKFDLNENCGDICFYLLTLFRCEFDFQNFFVRMTKKVFSIENSRNSFEKKILRPIFETILKKIFPENDFNEIISMIVDALKIRKISKWDEKFENKTVEFLRRDSNLTLEILLIFVFYSILLDDPFEKVDKIVRETFLPIVNENRNKFQTSIVEEFLRFYLAMLWNESINEKVSFRISTECLTKILGIIQWPSIVLWKFISIYSCFLPLYSRSVKFFQDSMVDHRFNQKIEFRLINKIFVLKMNFLRHIQIHRANSFAQQSNSGYEHRVRNIFRQLTRDYPNNVQLWNFYEQFERFSKNNQNRIKAVLYDAMQNCPWVKNFYMKSIEIVKEETEWKLFVNVMFKSGVRLLLSLDEFEMLQQLIEMKEE